MVEKNLHIGEGKREAFLVCDHSLISVDAPFLKWLCEEGFVFGGYHGNYGCSWIYVNITRKQYAYGMPGVGLAEPLGNHAITIEEFKTTVFTRNTRGKNYLFLARRSSTTMSKSTITHIVVYLVVAASAKTH